MGRQSPELEELVLLQPLRKVDVIEVVEAVDRVSQGLEVLFFDQKIVIRIVDGRNVQL